PSVLDSSFTTRRVSYRVTDYWSQKVGQGSRDPLTLPRLKWGAQAVPSRRMESDSSQTTRSQGCFLRLIQSRFTDAKRPWVVLRIISDRHCILLLSTPRVSRASM